MEQLKNLSNSQNSGVSSSSASNQQQATPNHNFRSCFPSTSQQQGHSQYPQTVNGSIQQPAMAQATSRPSEQYPQMLVPSAEEMGNYYSYLQFYVHKHVAKCYMDFNFGVGVFDKCDSYQRWLHSVFGK